MQKRKIRKKEADEDEGGLDLAALEAEAAAAGPGKDRGSRSDKAGRDAAKAALQAAELVERRNRYHLHSEEVI